MNQALPSPRLLISTAATALVASLGLALAAPTALVVDGQRLPLDIGPVTAAGQAYIPVAAVAPASGADAHYDAARGTVTIRRGTEVLQARIGDPTAMLDGRPLALSHAPFAVHGEAMIAADDLERVLGARVRYDARKARVEVRTPGVVVAGAADDEP